jgi:hypothetical protein
MKDTLKFTVAIVISIVLLSIIFGAIASSNIDLGVGNLFLAIGIFAVVFVGVFLLVDDSADKIEDKLSKRKKIKTEEKKYSSNSLSNYDFKTVNEVIQLNGYYVANISGYNSELGVSYHIYFGLVFNKNGYVAYMEDENEIKFSIEEISEFIDLEECDKLGNISKYNIVGDQILMKFYEPEDGRSYEKDIVNPNYFKELRGIVKRNSIVVDYFHSGFNDALEDYEINKVLDNLKFVFIELKK